VLKHPQTDSLTAQDVFSAFDLDDPIAKAVIHDFIQLWGMATANLISLFNPECLIFGGGVFGPAVKFIPEIQQAAFKWAQPISMKRASFQASQLGSEAGVTGAGYLALKNIKRTDSVTHE
jgi:glucokinase